MGVRQQEDKSQMHRRKTSTEEDEHIVIITSDDLSEPELQSNGAKGVSSLPPSAGPYRTSFGAPRLPNGQPPSPFRSSFSHSRSHTRVGSVSTQPLLSPMSAAFPANSSHSNGSTEHFPTSNPADLSNGAPSTKHNRRHSRLHSRNLSIFFPRPDSLPEHSIAEDGTQELELGITDEEAPISDMPSAESPGASEHRKKLKGFTFGGRPSEEGIAPMLTGKTRRGHHHKHSLSHNFFSFLEPGSQPSELHTAPTPIPVSPWNPVSPFPESAGPTKTTFVQNGHVHHGHEHGHQHASPTVLHSTSAVTRFSPIALAATMGQFLLGAWLWVSGQQIGSLACTGLGYWVVFDSFGIALNTILPVYLAKSSMQSKIRRPYGNARIETVAMFAQSVYLMFSSVYVCKETVEHLLLSAGEGHHHHHGDEEPNTLGIEFPIFLVFITLMSLIITSLRFNNHAKLVNTAGNHIPSIGSVIRDTFSRYPSSPSANYGFRPSSPTEAIISNPFILFPILFCISILLAAAFMPLAHYRTFDLVLAAVETVATFNVAYRASVVLGTVLLQTSPERGLSGGRMEAFLRAMKEVERHPQVLHLPAPHIWQLTPSLADTQPSSTTNKEPAQSLVVTMELHVPKDLGDDDVLELTRWAWERCVNALHFGTGKVGQGSEAEVTVGVVRG